MIRSRSVDIPRSFVSMVVLALALSLAARPAAAAPQTRATIASGIVTDASGAPLARVRVRAVDATGIERGVALTDDAGRFLIAGGGCSGCRVEASPPGFLPNAVAVAGSAPLRLALALAPVRETVVVTPTRDDAPSSQVGSAMTVFDRDDIVRAGEPPLSDLLATVPGAAVVANGAPGSVTSLFVRGGESSYNRVLLDGIPLNEPGGTFDFGNLTTVGIERVEIVRGAESALFGSDAMASVVQLFSRRGQVGRPPSGTFAAEGGTYRTGRVTAAVSGGAGAWDYALSTARFQTNNRVPNDAFDNTTVSADVGGPIGPTMRLRVVGRFEGGRTGVPGQAGFGRPDLDASFDRRNGTIGATVESSGPGRWRQQASIALSRSLQVSRNLVEDPPYIPSFDGRTAPFAFYDFLYDSRNDIRRYHASYQSDWRFDAPSGRAAHILTAAVDWDGERATLDDRLAGTSLAARRDNVGWTVQHQYVGPRLSTTAGLRVEHNASFGTAAVPRVSAAWTLRRGGIAVGQTTLHGSAGLGIKEPTILQSFSTSPYYLGNPDLEPERSRSIDAGVTQRLAGQRVRLDLTAFAAGYRNQITTVTTSFNPYASQYFNVGRTRARGTELSIDVVPVDTLRIRAGHTFLASRIVDSTSPGNEVFRPGAWTFRRPRQSGFLEVSADLGRLSLDLTGVFVGRRVDSDFSSLVPAITESNPPNLWNAGVRYRATTRMELYARVQNLTNADYMDPPGYPAWRRTGAVGLRIGLGR